MSEEEESGRANMEWRVLEEGGAAIVLNAPMLALFTRLAEHFRFEVQVMLVNHLASLLFDKFEFERIIYSEQ